MIENGADYICTTAHRCNVGSPEMVQGILVLCYAMPWRIETNKETEMSNILGIFLEIFKGLYNNKYIQNITSMYRIITQNKKKKN